MKYTIRFTPEAEETFDALSAQLIERWGDRYVRKFEDRISKSLATISRTPFLYPVILEETQIRKCIVHRNCSLLYKVIDHTVMIICFWDNRQNLYSLSNSPSKSFVQLSGVGVDRVPKAALFYFLFKGLLPG